MARKFDLNKIVSDYCSASTRGGRSVNILEIVDHISGLSGRLAENVRKSVLPILMEKMARVSEEDYVDEETLTFDVDAIDDLIAKRMLEAEYLPIRAFGPFNDYPPCSNNWSWNLFIFESFCLKRSRRFKRLSLLFNKQCSGAIVSASYNKTFHEMIIDAVARSPLERLDAASVVAYLKELGYIGKAKYERVDELISAADELRGTFEYRWAV